MERVPLGAEDAEMVRMLADDTAVTLLAGLPRDQRSAIRSRVIEDRSYEDIAVEQRVGEPVIRQRVSRGLASLRQRMGGRR